MKKIWALFGKVVLIFIACVALIFIGIKIYFIANSEDDELLDNSHLVFETINVPNERNGWFELKKAEEKMYYPEDKRELIDKMINGESWNQEIADEIVEKNLEALAYFNKSVEYEFIADPLKNNLSTRDLNPYTVFSGGAFYRNLNRLNLISAKNEIKKGNFDSGIDKIILSIKVADKIKEKSISLIDYLLVLSLNTHNRLVISGVADELAFQKDKSILLQKELEKNKKNKETLANAFRSEFWNMVNGFDDLYIDENLSVAEKEFIAGHLSEKSNFYLKPNRHMNDLNKIYTRNVDNSYRACDNLIPFDNSNSFEYRNSFSLIFTENAISKILISLTNVNLDSAHKKRCIEDFDVLALQVELGANAFRNDNRRYPENISEMLKSGHLIVDVPESLNGWKIIYDKENGELKKPKELEGI